MNKRVFGFILLLTTYYSLLTTPSLVLAQQEGAPCTYPQNKDSEVEVCRGTYQKTTSGAITCQYTSGVDPGCVKANSPEGVFGKILPPLPIAKIGFGSAGLGNFISNLLNLFYSLLLLVFLFVLVRAGLAWITSGGEKEVIAKQRSAITNAMIGLVIVALAMLATNLIGQITGFSNLFTRK